MHLETPEPNRHWDRVYTSMTRPLPWDTPELPTEIGRWLSALPAGAEVLDVGCGLGDHAAMAAHLGLSVIGVDASPVAIRHAVDTYGSENPHFVVADIVRPLPGVTFDFAYLYGVLHHISPSHWSSVAHSLFAEASIGASVGIVTYATEGPSGARIRTGHFGNTMFHTQIADIAIAFNPYFTIRESGRTRLGRKQNHSAIWALLDRSSE